MLKVAFIEEKRPQLQVCNAHNSVFLSKSTWFYSQAIWYCFGWLYAVLSFMHTTCLKAVPISSSSNVHLAKEIMNRPSAFCSSLELFLIICLVHSNCFYMANINDNSLVENDNCMGFEWTRT